MEDVYFSLKIQDVGEFWGHVPNISNVLLCVLKFDRTGYILPQLRKWSNKKHNWQIFLTLLTGVLTVFVGHLVDDIADFDTNVCWHVLFVVRMY